MAKLTLKDAEAVAARGRPWSIRLEGHSTAPGSKMRRRYFYATGRGLKEPVEFGWGAIDKGQDVHEGDSLGTWDEAQTRVAFKLSRGFGYVRAPYRRMSTLYLAQVTTGNPQKTPVVSPAPKPKVPTASLVALGHPWSLIQGLRMLRKGTTVTGYAGLDGGGKEVHRFDPQDGIDFARTHNLDISFM